MPPDNDRLTRQDLIFAAHALRRCARADEKQGADPGFASLRGVYESSAKAQDALAEKLDRIARRFGTD